MTNLKDKQNFQILNIVSTLIEATEHFAQLIKRKEMNQSIYILNTIVEGVGTVRNAIASSQSTEESKEMEKVEKTLLLIAQEMEKGKLIKVSEIIQFSLLPQLRTLKERYKEYELDISKSKLCIGVFMDEINPREFLPDHKINALAKEGENQKVDIIFFSSEDVNFEKKIIVGDVYQNGGWARISKSFPDVIYNVGITVVSKQSLIERRLRKEIPFTNFGLGNKYYLPEKLIKNRKYAELLVPFKLILETSTVYEFLEQNTKAVIKSILGSQGSSVFFVEKKSGHYIIHEGKKKSVLGQQKFSEWVYNILAVKDNTFIIQEYVESRTRDGEPFDIRAHMQKNSKGEWQITKVYPRIGHRKSILSNISQGGRTEDIDTFLNQEFGKKGGQYSTKLKELVSDLTFHVDKLFSFSLSDIGIDITIDKNGRFWMHEINNEPGTTYHSEDWATNIVGYATYIAKNGIYTTNEFQKRDKIKGEFNAKVSKLQITNLDKEEITIGMLMSELEDKTLAVACAYVAKYEGIHFYYFTPKDIDFETRMVRGYFYDNKEWTPKVVRYPDVVYDRLRLRGIENNESVAQRLGDYKAIYEELEGIPVTNEFYGDSISKLEVYDKLLETEELNDIIIPYQKVNRTKDIFDYIKKYGSVIVKPEVGSFAKGVHLVSQLESGEYLVGERDSKKVYNEWSLTKYLSKLIGKGTFLAQKYIETRTKEGNPFDIRVHLMKDGKGEWSIVESYPRVGVGYATILVPSKGGYMSKLPGFLERNFEVKSIKDFISKIENVSLKVATVFESVYFENVSEAAIDLAIDKEMNIHLIEVNVNKPGINFYEFEVAQHAIPYAAYLAELHKNLHIVGEE